MEIRLKREARGIASDRERRERKGIRIKAKDRKQPR